MKKLYVNIDEIDINGEASDLYFIVTSLDKRIETLANETLQVGGILSQYADADAGKQFTLATNTVSKLSMELRSSAEAINELQRDVCKFVEKVNEYEGIYDNTIFPRSLDIQIVNVSTNSAKVKYKENDMMRVVTALRQYIQTTIDVCQQIIRDENDIGDIWRDRQYDDFSLEIDQLVSYIKKEVVVLNDYTDNLNKKIRNLD